MTWPTVRPAASIASASRNFVTICSGVCLVSFTVESLQGQPVAHRDSHKHWISSRRQVTRIEDMISLRGHHHSQCDPHHRPDG